MVKVGIDTLAIYTARYKLDLATLASARGIDSDKYQVGLGQLAMSVPPPGEDIVTMAASAAHQALQSIDIRQIAMLLFATESSIDQSKAAGIYVHDLLNLPATCRVIELKQACYSATAALQLSLPFLRENPDKKVLVIASDIARYGLNTPGESSQGCGAVAMVLSTHPRILAFEPEYGVVTENVMDFWRPNYLHEALVDGKYSSKLYLTMLEKSWQHYQTASGRQLKDHAYFCYHTPVPRLVEKAHQHLLKVNHETSTDAGITRLNDALHYSRQMGNSYTASLYISLASLLDCAKETLTHQRIGFYSYGSGCVAEYFSGIVQPSYREALHTAYHQNGLASRSPLTYEEYEKLYTFSYVEDGSTQIIPDYQTGHFRLTGLTQHKRQYEKKSIQPTLQLIHHQKEPIEPILKIHAPGKLILSGEHAVVYGQPALAMAMNRYVTATITRETQSQVSFDLLDLAHQSQLSVGALHHLKNKIKEKYYRFIRGDYNIREVLQKPFELAQFTLGILSESLNLSLPHGVKIKVQSDLPIGCGMGSSAATIVSVMQAILHYLQIPIAPEKLFELALEAENMQHGYSSGLDLKVALQGGCLYVHGQEIAARPVPTLPMYLVNTGTPLSSTGECVEKASVQFKSMQLCQAFAAVTKAMDAALLQQSWNNMREAIDENHKLLVRIGVVPEKVQHFIKRIAQVEGAAKICGAGAVTGDQAGAVLVSIDETEKLSTIAKTFGYSVSPITAELRGVHAA